MVWKNIKIQGDTDSTHQLYSIQRQMNKGDVIVKLSNSNLDLEILNAESELAEKQ